MKYLLTLQSSGQENETGELELDEQNGLGVRKDREICICFQLTAGISDFGKLKMNWILEWIPFEISGRKSLGKSFRRKLYSKGSENFSVAGLPGYSQNRPKFRRPKFLLPV